MTDAIAPDEDLDMMDSIFGDFDITEINDDPFWIETGTYQSVCTTAKYQVAQDDPSKRALILIWTIDEPESQFNGKTVREYFQLPPKLGPDGEKLKLKDLDAKQLTGLSHIKKRMRRAFDLSETEAQTVKPASLVGKIAYVTIVNRDGEGENKGKKFRNVTEAVCERLLNEERGGVGVDKSGDSFGI